MTESLPTHVSRSRLTPRSAEACRRTGIEPAELLPVPQSAFREPGQSAEVEKLRWEKYEELRLDAYQAVRAERARVVAEGRLPGPAQPVASSIVGSSSASALLSIAPEKDAGASTAAELERRMVERIKKKQQAEIEQMLLFEIRAAQLNDEKAQKLKDDQERDAQVKQEREARQRAAAEARRKQELERKEAEAVAEREQRRRQQVEMRREALRREQEEEAERQRLVALDRKERERAAKQEARRVRQQELMTQQTEAAYKKQEEDTRKEQQRMARLEETRQKKLADNAIARDKQAQRIRQTMAMQQERQLNQRNNYLKKMENEELRREQWNAERQRQIEERRQAGQERAAHIKEVQHEMEAVVESKKSEVSITVAHRRPESAGDCSLPCTVRPFAFGLLPQVIQREAMHERIKQMAHEKREKELAAAAAEKEMKMYTRQLKQLRHQRRDEYKREVMATKIELTNARTETLLTKKMSMLAQRRTMRAQNVLARQSVAERIEKMRSTSSFDVDPDMRGNIQNQDLLELLERCDAITGGGKVPLDTMRQVLSQMQLEGKLGSASAPNLR